MIIVNERQTLNVDSHTAYATEVAVEPGTVIWDYVHLSRCKIGKQSMIGTFVEIGAGVTIGDRGRIQSHTTICANVTIGADCFVAHGVVFVPAEAGNGARAAQLSDEVSIGSNATLFPVSIGAGSVVGAGAVVTDDVPARVVVAGNPAVVIRELS